MTVRAKIKLTAIEEYDWGGKRLKFSTAYDNTIPEDRSFCKATPSGHAEFTIDNPAAIEQFKLGEHYYIDFTPAK